MEKFQITFDADLENQFPLKGFNSKEEAIAFLNQKTIEELHELYIEWCEENGLLEDEHLTFEEFKNGEQELVIQEVAYFTPSIDVDDVLDKIIDEAGEFGGEYSEGFLVNLKEEDLKELSDSLQETLNAWFKKHKSYEPNFYQIDKEHSYQIGKPI